MDTMNLQRNDYNLAGLIASDYHVFGERNRYILAAVHTRFEEVTWMVFDAEQADDILGTPKIIRQDRTPELAVKGL